MRSAARSTISPTIHGPRDDRRAALERNGARDIDALYAGAAPPQLAGLGAAVAHFDLRTSDFLAVIDGMEMDVGPTSARRTARRSTFIATAWRARSAGFRCGCSAWSETRAGARPSSRPRAAAHQYSARPRRGCRRSAALSAARGAADGRHQQRPSRRRSLADPALGDACAKLVERAREPFRRRPTRSWRSARAAPCGRRGSWPRSIAPCSTDGRAGLAPPRTPVHLPRAKLLLDRVAPAMHSLMSRTVHIIGAGLAGLAAAVRLAARGAHVIVHEATAQAGGRCRSYYDAASACDRQRQRISCCRAIAPRSPICATIGAAYRLRGPAAAEFRFVDLAERRSAGPCASTTAALPWWIFEPKRRVPRTRALDYLPLARLLWPPADRHARRDHRLQRPAVSSGWSSRFCWPRSTSMPPTARRKLAGAVMRETLAARRPRLPAADGARTALGAALSIRRSPSATSAARRSPRASAARAALCRRAGRRARFRRRDGRARRRATPSSWRCRLMPPRPWCRTLRRRRSSAPSSMRISGSIRRPASRRCSASSTARCEWIFALPGPHVGDDQRGRRPPVDAAARGTARRRSGRDVAARDRMPADAAALADRARAARHLRGHAGRRTRGARARQTAWRNLFLAGDWTATGLPATIEGAVRSGNRAADLVAQIPVEAGWPHDARCPTANRPMPAPELDATLDARSRAATAGAARRASGPTGIGSSSWRPTPPSRPNMCCCAHYLGEPVDPALEHKIAVYLRRIQGDAWRLAAVSRRRLRHERQREGLFRAQDDRRCATTRRICGAPARRSWRAAAPRMQRLHPRAARALRHHALAQRAGDAGRDHAAAALVSVPLSKDILLGAHRDRAAPGAAGAQAAREKSARASRIDELFLEPPRRRRARRRRRRIRSWSGSRSSARVDAVLRPAEPLFPKRPAAARDRRARSPSSPSGSTARTVSARSFPAMANSRDDVRRARRCRKRSAARPSRAHRSRSCWSSTTTRPIASPACRRSGTPRSPAMRCWRSAASAALAQRASGLDMAPADAGARRRRRLVAQRPDVRPGGWAFQYANPHYPDLDDTAVVVMAMDRAAPLRRPAAVTMRAIARAREWIEGLQSRERRLGGLRCRQHYDYLNNIPFADHGALLDPPTEDVTARCVSMLAQLGDTPDRASALKRGVDYLRRTQLADGSWYGRWGMNYIYGTWSVLCALNAAGVAARRAGNPQGGGLADLDPEPGRRLGRGRLELQARLRGLRAGAEHRLADRLGAARPDGRRRSRSSGGRARHRLSADDAGRRRLLDRGALHRAPVSRACSICATTAMRNSSRSGRWRATAISKAAMRARWRGGCRTTSFRHVAQAASPESICTVPRIWRRPNSNRQQLRLWMSELGSCGQPGMMLMPRWCRR